MVDRGYEARVGVHSCSPFEGLWVKDLFGKLSSFLEDCVGAVQEEVFGCVVMVSTFT